MIVSKEYQSPLGRILLAAEEGKLVGLWFEGQKYFLGTLPEAPLPGSDPVFEETERWLDAYFAGRDPGPLPPTAPRGSEFRQRVWASLAAIPYGQVTTYGAIAKELEKLTGRRQSARAVGGAVGHNPISIILPCHRVVGTNGSLTGYAGGVEIKRALLSLEGVELTEGLFAR